MLMKRIWDGDGDGTAIVDMGTYEFGAIPVGYAEPAIQSPEIEVRIYPNPLSTHATIEYTLQETAMVTVTIINQLGEQVEQIIDAFQMKGKHQLNWSAEGLPAGVYYCRIQSGKHVANGKLILMK